MFDCKTCVAHDAAHGECIYGIMARDREDADSIRHNDMAALAENPKSSLLKSGDSAEVMIPGMLGIRTRL